MDELTRIDEHVFFEMLRRLFFLTLSRPEKEPLTEALRYWEKNHSKEDERKLAYVMATVHHLCKAQAGKGQTIDAKRFKELFNVKESDWNAVTVTEGKESSGSSAKQELANRFFTALSQIKPLPLARVLADELKFTRGHDAPPDSLSEVFDHLHKQRLTALCFSGGGIRSATFGLGIIQALAKHNLLTKFDYLSTVSGGGYLGSWLSAWVLRAKLNKQEQENDQAANGGSDDTPGDDLVEGPSQDAANESPTDHDVIEETSSQIDISEESLHDSARMIGIEAVQERLRDPHIDGGPNPEPKQLQHLREYSNYMSPRVGLISADTWTLVAIYLRNLSLNLTIFIPLIAAILMLPRFLFIWTIDETPSAATVWSTLVISILSGGWAMAFVISRLPSKNIRKMRYRPKAEGPAQTTTVTEAGADAAPDTSSKKAEEPIKPAAAEKKDRSDAVPDLLDDDDKNTDVGVVIGGVLPLVITALGVVMLWTWNRRSKGAVFEILDRFQFGLSKDNSNWVLVYFLIGASAAFVFTVLVLIWREKADRLNAFAALVATFLGAILSWLVAVKVVYATPLSNNIPFDAFEWQLFFCFAVPLFLVIVLIAATVFVGLSSGKMSDEDREWLARFGGWVLIVSVVWILLNSIVLLGPSLLALIFRTDITGSIVDPIVRALVSLTGVASAVIALIGGFSEKSQVRNEPVKTRMSRFLAFAPRLASVIFLGFIFVGLASLTTFIAWTIASLFAAENTVVPLSHVYALKTASPVTLAVIFTVLAVVGVVMACFVNVNKFSLHGAYRDRLVRAYLGASNPRRKKNLFTGFDDSDNFQLHRLKDQKPFHVINATVNLVGGKTLAWQDRKAASFTMSPLHCGSWTLGYRNTNEYCRNEKLGRCQNLNNCNLVGKECVSVEECQLPGKAIRLGTAMAISGAAANPNMGYYSSSVVTFLMSLFNIRLGWWLGNTNRIGARLDYKGRPYYGKPSPTVAVLPLLNETVGRTDEFKRYINVTDGGHFENLALYEMVLRRCRIILLSDGAADATFKFGEIANAIQKCKVDLGVDIKFVGSMNIYARDCDDELKKKGSRFAIAQVTYPEINPRTRRNRVGFLLYMRPAYYGITEPRDIRYYAEANDSFPHQSTGDQMYDEKQFEAYRGLGFLTMEEIVRIGNGDPAGLEDLIKDELLELAKADLLEGRFKLAEAVADFLGEKGKQELIKFAKSELKKGNKKFVITVRRLSWTEVEIEPDEDGD